MATSAEPLNSTFSPTTALNDTLTGPKTYGSHSWEFLLAVLVTAVSVSVIIALLAKCQVIQRYLASYRHTRLRESDTASQCDSSVMDVEFAARGAVSEEDDDGFIEDNYIPASERARAERAAQRMQEEEDSEEEDDTVFTIA
ncbi:type III endosome membrane protein TEMP [Betta splendens]|uniref:Type III endosome membrane protein TEMP n=1 Tax=Betta splendens TaxID=158456 RepID=A0A6P7MGJ4_BETSP|nr:type III endosome membrane protein TEMP [Betta splendens]